MDDPNVWLILTPDDNHGRAADAFRLPHNRRFYVPPTDSSDTGPSRQATPVENETQPNTLEHLHRLILTFDHELKVPGRVSFGTDPELCDLLLAPRRGGHNFSFRQFHITFDDKRRPILIDASTNGTAVGYDRQAKDERRNHFRWIFFDDKYKEIVVIVQKQGLSFRIHHPRHEISRNQEYQWNLDRFIANSSSELFGFGHIRLGDPSVPSNEVVSSSQDPIYLENAEIGRGGFGRVCKVVNASTGDEYARKQFFHKTGWEQEVKIMERLFHV